MQFLNQGRLREQFKFLRRQYVQDECEGEGRGQTTFVNRPLRSSTVQALQTRGGGKEISARSNRQSAGSVRVCHH